MDLLGLNKAILSFAQKVSKNHVDPYKVFPDIYGVR